MNRWPNPAALERSGATTPPRGAAPACPPAAAKLRLEEGPGDTVVLRLRRPWSDGTTSLQFTKAELTEKLCALVPPPHANTVHYHGVFGARAAWRPEVLPHPEEVARRRAALEAKAGGAEARTRAAAVAPLSLGALVLGRTGAELLHRVFAVDGWACPCCGREMRLRAVVVGAPATLRILSGLAASRAVRRREPAPPSTRSRSNADRVHPCARAASGGRLAPLELPSVAVGAPPPHAWTSPRLLSSQRAGMLLQPARPATASCFLSAAK